MKNVFSIENILKVAEAVERNFDTEVTVTVPINDLALLKKGNEDFHYRLNKEGKPEEDIDTVQLKVGNVLFNYVYVEPPAEDGTPV